VWSARGAPGIDGESLKDYRLNLKDNLSTLLHELQTRSYRPLAVRRVEIPKPGGGVRKLGIPAVRDRIVQQALQNILTPIFDPFFHPSSYGYRKGRSCHCAIGKASDFIGKYNLTWVVEMDLRKCFDTLDHDLIIKRLRTRVADGSILALVRQFLESGVMVEGKWEASETGSPQGGVISPLLANIYLDAFDSEMRKRGHRIVRYADDILILKRSKRGAQKVLKQAVEYLEEELKLTVNREKTHVTHSSRGVKFLGVVIHTGYTGIQEKKVKAFKDKIRVITRRNSPVNLDRVIAELNPLLRGFSNYFRIANSNKLFTRLARWIRRRLRAKQMSLWKKSTRLHRRLRQLGYKGDFQYIRMSSWSNSASPLASFSMPNKWFAELGLFDLGKVETGLYVSGN
jgi:group II intron reverse transcriptase/maturase